MKLYKYVGGGAILQQSFLWGLSCISAPLPTIYFKGGHSIPERCDGQNKDERVVREVKVQIMFSSREEQSASSHTQDGTPLLRRFLL